MYDRGRSLTSPLHGPQGDAHGHHNFPQDEIENEHMKILKYSDLPTWAKTTSLTDIVRVVRLTIGNEIHYGATRIYAFPCGNTLKLGFVVNNAEHHYMYISITKQIQVIKLCIAGRVTVVIVDCVQFRSSTVTFDPDRGCLPCCAFSNPAHWINGLGQAPIKNVPLNPETVPPSKISTSFFKEEICLRVDDEKGVVVQTQPPNLRLCGGYCLLSIMIPCCIPLQLWYGIRSVPLTLCPRSHPIVNPAKENSWGIYTEGATRYKYDYEFQSRVMQLFNVEAFRVGEVDTTINGRFAPIRAYTEYLPTVQGIPVPGENA